MFARRLKSVPPLVLCFTLVSTNANAEEFNWQRATPESQGMSSARLDGLRDALAARGTKDFLVVRNDRIVYEWYAPGRKTSDKHYTASLAKAVVGGMALAVAINDGKISIDDPVFKYVPQWASDSRKSKITIRHLGSHTSGLEDSSVDGYQHTEEPDWKGEFWKRLDPPHDPFSLSRDAASVLFTPGTDLQYSNPGIAMLTYAVAAALQGTPEDNIRVLLRDRIMRPIGIEDREWSIGYGKTYSVDGLPLVAAWGGGAMTPRALARVGRLVLRKGNWDGTTLLSPEAVRQVTTDAGLPGNCGMGWWTNGAGRYPYLPRNACWGAGAGDQILLVVPSLNLIMVRNGAQLAEAPSTGDVFARYHDPRAKILFEPLIAAVTDKRETSNKPGAGSSSASCPQSPVITGIHWSPPETIVRQASGSDNWPLTWADDGAMYSAYGDGWGFHPKLPEKLSLGLAKIDGSPEDFRGTNIRSTTGERTGQGAKGEKASGMLMVDGVLYMWIRNAGNSQLNWSEDHAKTWTQSDWKFTTSFGCPTFLNFGKDYAGARDRYVYVYSQDCDSAYERADQMVLARVPQGTITDRHAYEFFVGLDHDGQPVWTRNVEERGPVFRNPGECYRSSIVYNPGIKRYLWCQTDPDTAHPQGMRFEGGFSIYDASEPWGPWATVFSAENWDVGPGETSGFPAKWMSDDGKTVHLVFSGNDSFSVRKATLECCVP